MPEPDSMTRHAIVIGGGLAGTSTAYMLASSGWHITLIERSVHLASGASGNHAGIVMPLITHKSDTLGAFYYQGFLTTLNHIQNIHISKEIWRSCGVVDINPKHAVKNVADICIPAHHIQKISFLGRSGFYVREGGHINVPDLCRAQITACQDNIRLIFSKEVLSLCHNGQIWKIDSNAETIAESPIVIIANSYDALRFKQTAWLPLQQVRGQVTLLPQQSIDIPHVVCMEGYITPAYQGYHHLGATYKRNSSDLGISIQDHLDNLKIFEKLYRQTLPDNDYRTLKGRVGIRCATPDRRALVGPAPIYHPEKKTFDYYPGLYINVAHGSRGLTSCILSAVYLNKMITNQSVTDEENRLIRLLLPSRFIERVQNKRW